MTHLRCDGIFSDGIIANFLLILTVKKNRKSVNICLRCARKLCQIFGPPYTLYSPLTGNTQNNIYTVDRDRQKA